MLSKLKPLLVLSLFLLNYPLLQARPQEINESFDVSLARLNSINKLLAYVDSCAATQNIEKQSSEFALLVNGVIEKRFYHSYSHYSLEENWIASIAGRFVWEHLSAIVLPEDIVKHEMAACSQQAIVMMEVLKLRGFQVRKLGLKGHFIMEAYYDNDWHVFDPNKEFSLPGLLHDSLDVYLKNGSLAKAYSGKLTPLEVENMFSMKIIGETDEYPAKNARLFHTATRAVPMNSLPLSFGFFSLVFIARRKHDLSRLMLS